MGGTSTSMGSDHRPPARYRSPLGPLPPPTDVPAKPVQIRYQRPWRSARRRESGVERRIPSATVGGHLNVDAQPVAVVGDAVGDLRMPDDVVAGPVGPQAGDR